MCFERLKQLRLERHLTKRDVAKQFKIAESTYGKWELGHRNPDLKTIVAIAEYFEVSVDYLLGKTDDPVPFEEQKTSAPAVGTLEWMRNGFLQLGIDVEQLTDAQVDILVKNTDSLAKMFRDEVAKSKEK